ncbi:rolling circle replication-associated protein [Bacillus cereus group sp. MYBK216-2]|uniref:rolling circle replication-associated protein n=1 Tax=unclassified Bacillus cereus group TaxID=2750818 RepID=UPI003F7AC6A8
MESYNCKLIDLGDYVKVIKYEKPIFTVQVKATSRSVNEKKYLDVQEKNLSKVRKLKNSEIDKFIHIVISNFKVNDMFITLTYKKEGVTINEASKDFDNWIKRMRWRYGDFKYVAIRSFQKRGTIHYHLLVDIPRLPKEDLKNKTFEKIWGLGEVYIERIYKLGVVYSHSPLLKYLVKNLKEFKADERAFGKRLYIKSKNLIEPTVIRGEYNNVMKHLRKDKSNLEQIDKRKCSVEFIGSIETQIYKKG